MHDGRFHDPHPSPYGPKKKKKSKPEPWQIAKSKKRKPFINQKPFLDYMGDSKRTDKERFRKCKNTIKNYQVSKFKLNLILETNNIDYRYGVRK